MSRRVTHKITVAKRNLHGSRMWWATCTCEKLLQGCFDKSDAVRMAADHAREVRGLPVS